MKWQPIETAPTGQCVLVHIRNHAGNSRVVKALRANKYEIDQDFCDAEFADYCEEDDTYYWPEGWYEDVYAETGLDYTYHFFNEKPTHWMPLPDPPEEGE